MLSLHLKHRTQLKWFVLNILKMHNPHVDVFANLFCPDEPLCRVERRQYLIFTPDIAGILWTILPNWGWWRFWGSGLEGERVSFWKWQQSSGVQISGMQYKMKGVGCFSCSDIHLESKGYHTALHCFAVLLVDQRQWWQHPTRIKGTRTQPTTFDCSPSCVSINAVLEWTTETAIALSKICRT